jgi:mono/diheme cytochrome c family protein
MMRFFSALIIFIVILAGCTPAGSSAGNDTTDNKPKAPLTGSELYQANCVSCHGAAGNLGGSGAKNLQISTLEKATIIQQVTQGKGMMSAYKGILSTDEIEKVADYVLTLRK